MGMGAHVVASASHEPGRNASRQSAGAVPCRRHSFGFARITNSPTVSSMTSSFSSSDDDDDLPLDQLVSKQENSTKASHVRRAPKKRPSTITKGHSARPPPSSRSQKRTRPSTSTKDAAATSKYSLPGQRKDPPPENDPLRIFYVSMREEKLRKRGKSSRLADEWLMVHGLLDAHTADKVLAAMRQRRAQLLQPST